MHIGFTLHDPHHTFWALIATGADEQARALGVRLTIDPALHVGDQIQAIQRFIEQRVDALLIGPIDSQALTPVAQRAIAAGIPLVLVDTALDGCVPACIICSDNLRGARLTTAFLAEQLGGSGALAHIQGPLTVQSAQQRAQGFQQVAGQHPGLHVAFEAAGDWSYESGLALMRAALASGQPIRGVFAANEWMTLGAADAITAAGLAGQIVVTGFDALPKALLAMRAGTITAMVRQRPIEIGRRAVELAWQIDQGQAVPPQVLVDTDLITGANLADAAFDTLAALPTIVDSLVESSTALGQERTLLRAVIDAIPDTHLFVKDRQSRFIITNAAHLATLGTQRVDEIVGKTDFDLFPRALAEQYFADEQAVMESGQALHDRVEPVVDRAGQHKWYLTSKVPLRDSNGQVIGHVGVSRDITAIKQAEEERARLQEAIIRMQAATLREVSTPLIPISDHVVVMPLVGAIDSRRAQQVIETLLEGITSSRADLAILDITGVPVIDTQVANALIRAAQAVKLLGAQVMLSGIRPEVAQTLVGLGVDLSGIITTGSLQSSIAHALRGVR